MGLFGKTKVAKIAKTKVVMPASKKSEKMRDLSWVISKLRITEKAAMLGDKNIYVFEVSRRAHKKDILDAIVLLFKVTPTRVNIVNRAPRTFKNKARNRTSTLPGLKKAHVYLKKGDSINLV